MFNHIYQIEAHTIHQIGVYILLNFEKNVEDIIFGEETSICNQRLHA